MLQNKRQQSTIYIILCYEKGYDSPYSYTQSYSQSFPRVTFMSVRPLTIATQQIVEPAGRFDDAAARLVLALDGTVMFANGAVNNLSGTHDLVGRKFQDVAAFEDQDEAFRNSPLLFAQENAMFGTLRSGQHVVRFGTTGQTTSLQFDLVNAQDGTRYVIASALEDDASFSSGFGALIVPAAVQQDTSVQNQSDIDHFLNLSNDLLIVSAMDGTFESINENFTTLLGFELQDLTGRTFLDLVHPEDRSAVRPSMQALLRGDVGSDNYIIDFECRVMSQTSRSYWMEWKHKKADGKLYTVGRDITGQKKHEQDLKHRERQLSEAEAIGHMGHWHWTMGRQDIEFSDEVYRIFGVEKGKFKPTLDSVNGMLHRRDAGRMTQAFQRAIIEQNDHEIDFRVLTPTGEVRHVRCQGRCQFDASGDVTGLYGIMQDVTEAQIHERALMEAKESAERAYAAKSQFLANMSHELRTPLNAIIGFSEMMQQQLLGPIGNDRYLDYIKGIRESGEHLLDLITDILDMSKIEAGKYEIDTEELNLTKVIRLAVHMIEGRAMESGIRVIPKLPNDNLQIVADRRAVMQIMLNLLSNAVKFSHANGVVEVETVEHENHVSIRVKDHGIGIPANKLGTITNPFEQAANQYTRSHEGSGLGLSITKELAELHGGGIHIESQVDVGTTVTIRLPLQAR